MASSLELTNSSFLSGTSNLILSNLGSAYFFNGEFKKAAVIYQKAVKLHPSDARLWANAGEAAMQTNVDATPYFKKAIELTTAQLKVNPDHSDALSLAASSYAAVGDRSESRRYIARVLDEGHPDVYALYDVAVAYTRLGDETDRQKTLDRMVAMGYSKELIARDANLKPRRTK